ncbi:putative aminotransferase [Xylaria cubensis]|nr:putative aminotransferase [Xylaria cubensis]
MGSPTTTNGRHDAKSGGKDYSYDVEKIRKEFPALQEDAIPLNNAAGSLVYQGAINSVVRSLSANKLNLRGGDIKSDHDVKKRRARYKELASFINAETDEIVFGPSTTALFRNLAQSLRWHLSSDSEIIVSILCHEAGITAWIALAKSLNTTIKWWTPPAGASVNTNPRLDLGTLRGLLTPKTRLVCCGHVNNVIGTIHPIRAVADLVHTVPGALLCVDGVAWAVHRAVDVKALDVDFYAFSWYKVFGPHIAQLYARRSTQQRWLTSLNHFHLDSARLDIKLGLGRNCYELEDCLVPIVRYLRRVGWDSIARHEAAIVAPLLDYLCGRPDLYTVYGERMADPNKRVSCVSFIVNGVPSSVIASEIHNTSNCRIISGTCWSIRTVNDVLKLGESGGVLRCSMVHYNTLNEVRTFISVLDRAVQTKLHIEDRPKL